MAATLAPGTAWASVQGTFERSYTVSGPVDLEVFTHSGDVVVHSGPSGTVMVRGKIVVGDTWFNGGRREEVSELEKNPPIRQDGNHLVIDYVNLRNIAIDFDVTVPADTTLHTHTGSGDQRIEGLQKGATLESGSGDLTLNNVTGDVHTQSGSGDVRGDGLKGSVSSEAGSGDIRLSVEGPGDVEVRTGSGNIEIRGVKGAAHMRAGSGDVSVEGEPKGEWQANTGSGNVNLQIPRDMGFDLDVSTSSGRVDVAHPVTMTVMGRVQERPRNVQGKVHGGGPEIRVHTSSGDIEID